MKIDLGTLHGQTEGWAHKHWLFAAWAAFLLLCIVIGLSASLYALILAPAALLLIFWTVVDVRKVFLLLMATIPISTEVTLPNGFGTDLPSEPLMIGLMLVAIVLLFMRHRTLSGDLFRHLFTVLVLLHIFWIFLATVQSDYFVVSLKFFLAKIWYLAVFYFLAFYLIRGDKDFITVVRWVFWPMLFTVVVTLIRHGMVGFSFAEVHKVLHPFQRNHVNYAASLSLFFPFLWLLTVRSPQRGFWRLAGVLSMGVFLVAIYFSYTRAAYGSLLLALGAYFVFRLRLIKAALLAVSIVVLAGAGYILSGNRLLELAPNYDTTISHREFGSLLEATAKGEDISTMERLYRWVAGVEMSRQAPVFGYGPGNFVNFYKSFTVNSFRTYVSRNEEQSGIHSYFLMTLVEQGWPGLIIFLMLSFYLFIRGEQIYHETNNPRHKQVVMAVLLNLVVIYTFLIINDLIETDKVGSFFFLSIAVLARMDILNKRESRRQAHAQIDSQET